ncbi:hypothetical protein MKW92_044213 [Papaver armeniacum]|nr:hypothetical protein MKW92_044213 [Papaver armeniacum]
MAVLRSGSKRLRGSSSSSSNSKTDVSDASLDDSERLRSRNVPARARPKAKPRKEHNSTFKDRQDYVRPYATDALRCYNENTGINYKLVEPGCISNILLPTCLIHHIDFTAKKSANAPVEMFFAELTTTNDVRCVTCCQSMGPKKSISGDKNNGCCYCKFYNVQHPRAGGFMAGGAGLFTDEKDYTI